MKNVPLWFWIKDIAVLALIGWFLILPALSPKPSVYVLDMEALSDALVIALLERREQSGEDLTEEQIDRTMRAFRDKVKADLFDLSPDRPVFTKDSLIHTNKVMQDLTPAVAEMNGLNLGLTIEDYLRKVRSQ